MPAQTGHVFLTPLHYWNELDHAAVDLSRAAGRALAKVMSSGNPSPTEIAEIKRMARLVFDRCGAAEAASGGVVVERAPVTTPGVT